MARAGLVSISERALSANDVSKSNSAPPAGEKVLSVRPRELHEQTASGGAQALGIGERPPPASSPRAGPESLLSRGA